MNRPNEEVLRNIYLDQELDIAVFLIKSGLECLQQDKLYKRKTFAILILIVTGLERFMKIIVYLRTLEAESRHLSQQEFRNLGHNLVELRDKVVTECFSQQYMSQAFAQDDLDYVRDDDTTNKMLEMLSDFAKEGRYIYLDGISNPGNVGEAPEALWEELGFSMINPDWGSLSDDDNLERRVDDINHNFVVCLERFFRALCRLFAWGELGNRGKTYKAKLREFWAMDDDELGKIQYKAIT